MSTTTTTTPSYQRTRKFVLFSAILAILFSLTAGTLAYFFSRGGLSGELGAAGQIASVIPGIAGVLVAAFALSAYMREEDGVLKLAEEAWRARNRFLYCSQYLYYSVSSDLGQSSENITCLDTVKRDLGRLLPEFEACLLNTELGRALAQKEIDGKAGDGSDAIFAVHGFIEQIEYFVKADPEDVTAFRDEAAENLAYEEMSGDLTQKQILDVQIGVLVEKWAYLAEIIEDLDSVEKLEKLLQQNYQHSVKDDLRLLMKEHGFGE